MFETFLIVSAIALIGQGYFYLSGGLGILQNMAGGKKTFSTKEFLFFQLFIFPVILSAILLYFVMDQGIEPVWRIGASIIYAIFLQFLGIFVGAIFKKLIK